MIYHVVIFLLIVSFSAVDGQELPYSIKYSNPYKRVENEYGIADSARFLLRLSNLRHDLLARGHLLANIDSVILRSDSLSAVVHVGEKYYWHSLGVQGVPEEMLSKAGYRKNDFNDKPFSARAFELLMTRLTTTAANSGFPFASFKLIKIKIMDEEIRAVLSYNSGLKFMYDSLELVPKHLVKPKFMESYLGIREGDPFSMATIDNIPSAIEGLSFCRLKESPDMNFQGDRCHLFLPLEPVRSNKVDAILGLLPNQQDGKLRLTGFVNLSLQNLFHSGKSLSLVWQQFNSASQKMLVNYRHPNLLYSPVGVAAGFNMIKQDTSFITTRLLINGFFARGKTELGFTTNWLASRSLSTPVDSLTIPHVIDYDLHNFGISYTFHGAGKELNPVRGIDLGATINLGGRKLRKIGGVNEAVYDSLEMKSLQVSAEMRFTYYKKISGPLIFYSDATLATLYNSDKLFMNDLLRLGGVNSLRGFNDLDLFVSSYALIRFEARLLLNRDSRLFLFYDQAFTDNKISGTSDYPLGFGTGLQLRTPAGDLQLVFALGVSQQQSLSLSQSKVHLGYVARF